MTPNCVFCGSVKTYAIEEHVIGCIDCGRMHADFSSMLDTMDCSHEWIETGTQRSWCKHCNIDSAYSFQHGVYITDEDLTALSWITEEGTT